VKLKKFTALVAAALTVAALAAGAALADGGGGNDNGPSITQVATQVSTVVQDANCIAIAEGDSQIGVNCIAANNNNVAQQICQIAADKIINSTFVCAIDTNVPVPGPQGDTGANGANGATGAQGPQGPPGRDGLTFLPEPLPADSTACPVGTSGGASGGFMLVAYFSNGQPVLDANGQKFTKGPICNGRDAVQCPNMGLLKYKTAHEISVMTGNIVVSTLNPAGQIVCVSVAQAAKWHKPVTKTITINRTIVKGPAPAKPAPPVKPSNTK
jgi:hypothetical protein